MNNMKCGKSPVLTISLTIKICTDYGVNSSEKADIVKILCDLKLLESTSKRRLFSIKAIPRPTHVKFHESFATISLIEGVNTLA